MATAKRNYFPDLASNVIRPALVEAMLLTEKHAGDAVYMATLAEELRNVEAKIAAMEEVAQFGSSATAAQSGSFLHLGIGWRPNGLEPSRANWMLVSATSSERSMTGRVSGLLNPQSTPLDQRQWLIPIRPPQKEPSPLRGRHRVPKGTREGTANRKVYEGKSKI